MNLQGKKLLMLGGTSYAPFVRRYADEKGFLFYCTGNTRNATLEKEADAFFPFDAGDKAAIERLVRDEKIDGILAPGNEKLIRVSIDITHDTGLPFYIDLNHWNELQDKKAFKAHCREFGVDTVEEYTRDEIVNKVGLRYPLVIKPTDGSGSSGVSVCKNEAELDAAIGKATAVSRTGSFIAERFILAPEFIVTYIIKDGVPRIWMLGDRYMNRLQDGFGGISNLSVFPSKHSKQYVEEVHPKMAELLRKYGPKNGTFFAQGFAHEGKLVFFDPALRFCGTLDVIPCEYIFGVNPLHWMINHSLTGVMDDAGEIERLDWALKGNCAAQLSVHVVPGRIAAVGGIDRIREIDGVIDVVQLLNAGDVVNKPGTLQQVLVRVFIVKKDPASVLAVIRRIYETVSASDDEGRNMIMPFKPYGLDI